MQYNLFCAAFFGGIMSKIYEKYLKLKENDNNALYLFRCGNFYIFIADDCDTINEYVVLKKVLFTKDIYKCGFPINSLNDYMRVFNNHKLNVQVIDEIDTNIKSYIDSIDINKITPLEALVILGHIKELMK